VDRSLTFQEAHDLALAFGQGPTQGTPIKAAGRHRDARWLVFTLFLVLHWATPQFDAFGVADPGTNEGGLGVSSWQRSSLPAAMPRSLPRGVTVELRLPKAEQVILPAGGQACLLPVQQRQWRSTGSATTCDEHPRRLQLGFLRNYYSRGPPDPLA
jgi:hypothetical protein